jgi:hypothetical protein
MSGVGAQVGWSEVAAQGPWVPPLTTFPPPPHFFEAAWYVGELGSTPGTCFTSSPPLEVNWGSGNLGTPFVRMQAANLRAFASLSAIWADCNGWVAERKNG